jgi:hypothetical protein
MYDKLGDMLNDFLETGRMPPKRDKRTVGESPEGTADANTGEGIPQEQTIPDYLLNDFYALGFTRLTRTPRFSECKKAYRRLIKANHPDTSGDAAQNAGAKNTAPSPQKRLTELVEAFKRISAWYEP